VQPPAINFQDLLVWQKSHALVLGVHQMTAEFPQHQIFALTSQLQRAAVSVPSNIAEGFKRRGTADKARFMTERLIAVFPYSRYSLYSSSPSYSGSRLQGIRYAN